MVHAPADAGECAVVLDSLACAARFRVVGPACLSWQRLATQDKRDHDPRNVANAVPVRQDQVNQCSDHQMVLEFAPGPDGPSAH